jgi:hypothetical protein
MASPPVEILLGVYLGLLTGIVPSLVAGVLGFVFRYFTGVTLPGLGVVVLAVAIAGVNGGLMGLVDPNIANSPRLLVALLVVMMLSLYAHSQGDKLGTTVPRRFSLRALRERTLSADVVEFVGGIGKVTVRTKGPVGDVEGYPPLPAELRTAIAEGTWEFPADLPLSELESRLAERLRTEHDLADVAVDVDARGRARVAAAPPMGALSRRVPAGHRAVSLDALVPAGMSRGESVTVVADGTAVDGTLLSARSGGAATTAGTATAADGGDEVSAEPNQSGAPTTAGGEGRVTVAVPRRDADALLRTSRGRVLVRSRGTGREFELIGLLHRVGKRVARVTVRAGGPLDGTTLGAAAVRDSHGVAVLAARRAADAEAGPERERGRRRKRERDQDRRWAIAPRGETQLSAGDELFVVGTRAAVAAFRGAVA